MITHASLKPELDCELIAFYGELDAAAAPDLKARLMTIIDPPTECLLRRRSSATTRTCGARWG
jgi:hypothetical protein